MKNIVSQKTTSPAKPPEQLPKLCGADMELGNFISGTANSYNSCSQAAQALLREVEGQSNESTRSSGHAGSSYDNHEDDPPSFRDGYGYGYGYYGNSGCYGSGAGGSSYGYNPQDWGRKFLRSNGGCVYIDLSHLEICIPEVLSAYDHVACAHAMLRIARQAQMKANEKLPVDRRIEVLANNTDGQGNSYGSHLNFRITRRAWKNIFHRKIHHLGFLASYQVSSIIFTGQGKVGSENDRPATPYQISARADFFETLVGEQTTQNRPIINARDEALCGSGSSSSGTGVSPAQFSSRLHVIFYDHTLCHVASLLKVGVMQMVLAMIERERITPSLILDDPLAALTAYSHDPTLRARARTVSGEELTAVDLQMRFLEEVETFVNSGGCDGIVPHARELLFIWRNILVKLQSAAAIDDVSGLDSLAPQIDWVLKLMILRRAMEQHPQLTWDSPQIKYLDQLYSSLEPSQGLYWAYEKNGFVERVVSEAQIERFIHEPPADTRAWTRAMLLRMADPGTVSQVDWDSISFRLTGTDSWPRYRTLNLADPSAFTREQCEPLFNGDRSLDEVLDALGATPSESYRSPIIANSWNNPTPASWTRDFSYPLARSTSPKPIEQSGNKEHPYKPSKHEGGQNHEIS